MKKLLLSLMFLIVLSMVVGCSDTIVPEIPDETPFEPTEFIGWWVNVDMVAGITQLKIEEAEGAERALIIHEWAKCEPTDCYWGYQIVLYSDALDGIIEIIWLPWFAEKRQELTLLLDGSLQVKTFVHFVDNSGRPDYETVDYFTLYE